MNKPQKELFEELVKKSGVKAEEIVYADDHEPSVKSANSIGINTFFFESFTQFIDELRKLGVNV